MKTIRFLSMIAAFSVLTLAACEDDDSELIVNPPPPLVFEDLTERWHVLNNVEAAYNHREIDEYDELLDNDFTFFLSTGDVGGGLPDSWDRPTELQANTNIFRTDQPPAPLKRVLSIEMNVVWEDDQGNPAITWNEVIAPNTETWYTTTVNYDFQIEVEGDLTYIDSPGSAVQFTVRNAGTEDAPQWRLVEMRDLGGQVLVGNSAALTEQSTWGQVKALYREPTTQAPEFQDLGEMWHVMNNIEMAYSRRNLTRYVEVLDNDFTFFLSAGDVGAGLPASWGRDVEVQVNTNIFSADPRPRVLSFRMDIRWEDDQGNPNVAWTEFAPPGLTESWYTTTVGYDFKIDVEGDLTYVNNPGSMLQFTVRNAGTDEAPQWRLLEMRDLVGEAFVTTSSTSTESKSWGGVKFLLSLRDL